MRYPQGVGHRNKEYFGQLGLAPSGVSYYSDILGRKRYGTALYNIFFRFFTERDRAGGTALLYKKFGFFLKNTILNFLYSILYKY